MKKTLKIISLSSSLLALLFLSGKINDIPFGTEKGAYLAL